MEKLVIEKLEIEIGDRKLVVDRSRPRLRLNTPIPLQMKAPPPSTHITVCRIKPQMSIDNVQKIRRLNHVISMR
jgi:hypothetical protein